MSLTKKLINGVCLIFGIPETYPVGFVNEYIEGKNHVEEGAKRFQSYLRKYKLTPEDFNLFY